MNCFVWLLTYPVRRLLVELRYRRAVKKWRNHMLEEAMRIGVEVQYAFEKTFL